MKPTIKFRDEFIVSILHGEKTQTRRPMKPQPEWIRPAVSPDGHAHGYLGSGPVDGVLSPYGGVGHRLRFNLPNGAYALLEITGVRCERLQVIDEADAIAEGCLDGGCLNCGESSHPVPCGCANPKPDHRDTFAQLWQSIYGDSAFEWHANPWVWVYEFRVVDSSEAALKEGK